MADCSAVSIGRIKQKVTVGLRGGRSGGKIEEERIFSATLNTCKDDPELGKMTIIEEQAGGGFNTVIESDKNNDWNTTNPGTVPDFYFKELSEKVYPQFKNSRIKYFNQTADPETQNQAADVLKIPGVVNVAQEDEERKDANSPEPATSEERERLQLRGVENKDERATIFPTLLCYPESLRTNEFKQDYIKIIVLKYSPRIFTTTNLERLQRFDLPANLDVNKFAEDIKKIKKPLSTIYLPIQGGISDSNTVNWTGDQMNALEQATAFASLSGQTGGAEAISSFFPEIVKLATGENTNPAIRSYIHAYFAQKAISSGSNFFSRAFGAILNPNLELLFQGPDLRTFNLRFDLTPRNTPEAKQVKQIIRVLKQSMAVRQGVAEIFLKTPMIYNVQYINGKNGENHTSIGRIKTCALRAMNVNYTPANQYMTYNDEANTMSAYSIDLTFQELEPVFYDDYLEFQDDKGNIDDQIGY